MMRYVKYIANNLALSSGTGFKITGDIFVDLGSSLLRGTWMLEDECLENQGNEGWGQAIEKARTEY